VILLALVWGSNRATVFGQGGVPVPSPPTDLRDRFGIYNWGVDYTSYPTGSVVDRLNWGADRVAEIGSRTIRVAMPGDIYAVGQLNDDLAQAAMSPAYDKLFSKLRPGWVRIYDTGRQNIPPGSVITITGGRFSAGGNTVIIEQGAQRFTAARDADWSESTTEITAKLPDGVQSGRAQVYVINQQGRESRAVVFAVARLPVNTRPPIRRGR
jgi:hypothetical protein